MRQIRHPRIVLFLGIVFSLVLTGATRAAPDPVEDLRQALDQLRPEDLAKPSPAILKFRDNILKEKVSNLKTEGNWVRALALDNWLIIVAKKIEEKKKKGIFDADVGPINSELAKIDE